MEGRPSKPTDLAGGLRRAIDERRLVAASWLFLGSPATTEIVSLAGFDCLILDREHSPGGLDTLYHQLRASRVPVIVRLASADPAAAKLMLDAGAAGVAVSNLETAEDASTLVQATRYTPTGSRGIQRLSRAADYGLNWQGYRRGIGAAPLTMGLIESRRGVANLEAIAATDGLDVIFVGAVDLASDMGRHEETTHPEVEAVIATIERTVLASGKTLGGLALDEEDARRKRQRGYGFLSFGSDALYVRDGAVASANVARAVTREAAL
ncbi:MAG: 2-dehydro-3-deoxyglucarate aldolase [Devosiaceae bacterium]|nr:2-dehydro-3-deoxyglucarate aldolase [Devosiaceae bacterium MH13]